MGRSVQPKRRRAQDTPKSNATRRRVLAVCRILFNERGFTNVRTAEIAAALGMNEGHLHYYFNTKRQIITALFADYEAAVDRVIRPPEGAAHDLDTQQRWFLLMWRYQFFYRDDRAISRIAPELRKGRTRMLEVGQQHLRHVLDEMVAAGFIDIALGERETVLVNSWIVSSYWIDYLATLRGTHDIQPADLDAGMHQVDAIYAPYLTARGREYIAQRRDFGSILRDASGRPDDWGSPSARKPPQPPKPVS